MLAGRLFSPLRAWETGFSPLRWLDRLRGERLTVICYHRIWPDRDPRFRGYCPNISATPEVFAQQIDYLRKRYNPISVRNLADWLAGEAALPPRPLLITFDDGYRDNGEIAWPILRERDVPAVVFLATDHIGTGRPFAWDFAAFCFSTSKKDRAIVPLVGTTTLSRPIDRDLATEQWVEALKFLPAGQRENAMAELAAALDVAPPASETFQHLYLNWAEVKQLASEGLEFGGHTHTHPILTRLPVQEASAEIALSVERLTAALGSRPLSFAYPNGSPRDYTHDHELAASRSGVAMAFTLEPGPTRLSCVRENPMAIRRIYVGKRDNMVRFAAKLRGAARLTSYLRMRCRKTSAWSRKIVPAAEISSP